jgi:hypothetical protein
MQSSLTPAESEPQNHEVNNTITINVEAELTSSDDIHQQQLFEPPLFPPVVITPGMDVHQPPPSYEEVNDPNGITNQIEKKQNNLNPNIGILNPSFTSSPSVIRFVVWESTRSQKNISWIRRFYKKSVFLSAWEK